MKSKKQLAAALAVLCVVVIGCIAGIKVFAGTNDNTIVNGIFINTVDVGGMTEEQAVNAVNDYLKKLDETTLTVMVEDKEETITIKELGYTASVEDTVAQALNFGKTGNFIKRYKDIKDLENENMVLNLGIALDKDGVQSFVENKCTEFDVKAKNARLSRKDGKFIVKDHVMGRKLSVDDTVEKIITVLNGDWNYEDVMVEAVVMDEEPEYTAETLALCKDVLGTFSTTYASSSASRANNLANGAKLINGSIIWPGETFSTGGTMAPITVANGYSIAGAYENGQVVDSIGGGVCQVSTTLYNAALRAELEIAERAPHSMIVGYVKPAMDAAIAGTYKDLKIKNNTDVPIYIEGTTEGRTITFTIYGHETRDTKNRTIEFESKTLQVIQPGKEKITEDKTLPESYRKVTQSAHVGYRAELWKIVYENGVEVSRELVNTSSYAAVPAYVTVGTKKDKEEEEDEKDKEEEDEKDKEGEADSIKDKDTDKDKDKDKDKKPAKPTPAPTPTPTPEPAPDPEPEPEPAPEPSDPSEEEDVPLDEGEAE